MSLFGPDYDYEDDSFVISGDLDMDGNRIRDLRNPADSYDAVNKKYMNKRIEYKTKYLENELSTIKSSINKESGDNLQRLRLFNASIQKNKDEISKLRTEKPVDNNASIEKIQNIMDGTEPMTSNLNMGKNRIINVAHPRNPKDNADYDHDVVTAKFLYDYIKIADRKFLKTNEDSVLDGRLNLTQHRITGLADPVNIDDAVTKRYVASRIQAIADALSEIINRIERLERLMQ